MVQVKHIIISTCLMYSFAMVNSLNKDELIDRFHAINLGGDYIDLDHLIAYYGSHYEDEFKTLIDERGRFPSECCGLCSDTRKLNLYFREFKDAALQGYLPFWKIEEIEDLWMHMNTDDHHYITIDNFNSFFVNDDNGPVWRAIQDKKIDGRRIVGDVAGDVPIDYDVFRRAASLGLIPRSPGLHNTFMEIIGPTKDNRQYIIQKDMDDYYKPGEERPVQGHPVLNYYGIQEKGERRLYFAGFFRAVNLGYLPKPEFKIRFYPKPWNLPVFPDRHQ